MEAHGEEGEAPSPPPGPGGGVNVFANDGSFLELFKRKMEAEQQREREAAAAAAAEAPGGAGPGPHRSSDGSKRSGGALTFVRTRGPRPPPAPAPARPTRPLRLRVRGGGAGGGFLPAAAVSGGRTSPRQLGPRAQAPVLPAARPGSWAGVLGGSGSTGAPELCGHLRSSGWGARSGGAVLPPCSAPGGPRCRSWLPARFLPCCLSFVCLFVLFSSC